MIAKYCSRCGGKLEKHDDAKACTNCHHVFTECECGCHGLCDKGVQRETVEK